MKFINFLFLTLFVVFSLSACEKDEAPANPINTDGWDSVTVSNITFKWQFHGDTLEVELSAPASGWVAVGFGATKAMKDANIIIGYVSNGQTFIRDDFGVSSTSHKADTDLGGTNDIIEYSGTEANGTTTLKFKIPANSGDKYDVAITKGQSYKVILGYSNSDDFTSFHAKVTSTTVQF